MSVAGLLLVRDIQGSFITAEINGRREKWVVVWVRCNEVARRDR